jgi:hypothetical protein
MEQLLKKAVENMVWMANYVHQAYHFAADEPTSKPRWQDCSRGLCGNMEHMLAQTGFDKDLNSIPVRP